MIVHFIIRLVSLIDMHSTPSFYNHHLNNASIILKVADSLIRVSRQLGITTTAVITEMDNPLGRAVGNSLEVCL